MNRHAPKTASTRRRLRLAAAALGRAIPLESLHTGAVAAIRARPRNEPVAIACSGGADSVALLLLLWTHLPERRGHWLVVHFDHRLRARASAADARFVEALSQRLGEQCRIGTWQRNVAAKKIKTSEAAAREARWMFFGQAMRDAGAHVIALGHQRNDIAETMLMRLVRGSGSGALAAPRPVQRMVDGTTRIRPLLPIASSTLRLALQQWRVPWREDATNAGDGFFRNRVRRRVLPALEWAAEREITRGFGDARSLLEEDDDALTKWLDELVPAAPCGANEYDLSSLRGRPPALARRAVQRWFRAVGLAEPPKRADVDRLVGAILSASTVRFSAGRDQIVDAARGTLRLLTTTENGTGGQPWPPSELGEAHDLTGPRGDRLALRRVRPTARLLARIRAGDFPRDRMAYFDPGTGWVGRLTVRNWQPGDRYRPIGAPGRSKLQDLFVNRRVPRELRPLLPVVLNSRGEVLWVPGLPVADEVAIQPAAKLVVQLTYTPAPPMVHRPKAPNSTDVRIR